MRVSVRCKRRIMGITLVIAVALVCTLVLSSFNVVSQSDVGVLNAGPSFVDLEIEEDGDLIYVHVALRDLNGWDNIYLVNVTIMDDRSRPISQVIYRQYANPTATTPVIEWEEIVGGQLAREQSSWQAVEIEPWLSTTTSSQKPVGLNVSFAYQSFPGDRISVICLDKGTYNPDIDQNVNLLSCEHLGPFSAEFDPAPMIENYIVPLSASLFIALASAAFMTLRRHYSNKLAKAIETKEAAAAED